MGTALIWYHDAALIDNNGRATLVVNEPSVSAGDIAETVNTPGPSQPAPESTAFAVVEADVNMRYTVRNSGSNQIATPSHKLFAAGVGQIALRPGQTIHFVDA